jgi:hypothetical protein
LRILLGENYVIAEYIGTWGCSTSSLLYAALLNISEGKEKWGADKPFILGKPANNIGAVAHGACPRISSARSFRSK